MFWFLCNRNNTDLTFFYKMWYGRIISSTYTSFTHCNYVDSKKMQYKTLKVYLSKLTFLYLNSVFFWIRCLLYGRKVRLTSILYCLHGMINVYSFFLSLKYLRIMNNVYKSEFLIVFDTTLNLCLQDSSQMKTKSGLELS